MVSCEVDEKEQRCVMLKAYPKMYNETKKKVEFRHLKQKKNVLN